MVIKHSRYDHDFTWEYENTVWFQSTLKVRACLFLLLFMCFLCLPSTISNIKWLVIETGICRTHFDKIHNFLYLSYIHIVIVSVSFSTLTNYLNMIVNRKQENFKQGTSLFSVFVNHSLSTFISKINVIKIYFTAIIKIIVLFALNKSNI